MRSRLTLKAALTAAAFSAALAGCSIFTDPPTPAAQVIAPMPKEYTCADSRQAGMEYHALPPGSILRRMIDDYGVERRDLRALHQIPERKC